MDFIKRNYWMVSAAGALIAGFLVFNNSYNLSTQGLTQQVKHTIAVATDVKWQLFERKLFSIEQQLALLSRNSTLSGLLTSEAAKLNAPFDQYINDLLDNQGCRSLMLLDPTGRVAYNSNRDQATIPARILSLALEPSAIDGRAATEVVLGESEPFPFHVCYRMTNGKGQTQGLLVIEIPREFLSVELHNTISVDSLTSYLVSTQGIMDQQGKIRRDTCITCRWSDDAFLRFSPDRKIKDTWALVSIYPLSQIAVQHVMYVSALDGLIGAIAAGIIIMILIHSVQLVQKGKGITNADIMLVQSTWNAVSEYSMKVIAGFYTHLFTDAPEVRPLFKSEESVRDKRMALMINTIVNSADSLEEFKSSIAQLAKRHTHMGVKKEYFPIVVKAIVSSVEEQYGKGFTSAHRKAWYKILNKISSIMIEEMEAYQRSTMQ